MKKIIALLLLCFTTNIFSYEFSDILIDLPKDFIITEIPPKQLAFENPDNRLVGFIYISEETTGIPSEILYREFEDIFVTINFSQKAFEKGWFLIEGITIDSEIGVEMNGYLKCLNKDGETSPKILMIYTPLDQSEDEKIFVENLVATFAINPSKFWTLSK